MPILINKLLNAEQMTDLDYVTCITIYEYKYRTEVSSKQWKKIHRIYMNYAYKFEIGCKDCSMWVALHRYLLPGSLSFLPLGQPLNHNLNSKMKRGRTISISSIYHRMAEKLYYSCLNNKILNKNSLGTLGISNFSFDYMRILYI